jgi:holo-[acyl-carrier protein] synthase
MRMPMTWRLCEVGQLPSGQPVIVLHGVLKSVVCRAKGLSAHITVTDESEYAASFCVVETHATAPLNAALCAPIELLSPS